MDYLVGSGIDVSHRNGQLSLSPLTDESILKRSNGALTDAKKVYGKDLKPEKGGLFDTNITGGPNGQKWSHYTISEPIVNPILEDPVRSILGLKKTEYADLTSGKIGAIRKRSGVYDLVNTENDKLIRTVELSSMTKQASDSDQDGEMLVAGHAFKQMLSDIDTDTEVKNLMENIHTVKSISKRDDLIKKVKYLHGINKQGYTDPSKAVMLHNIPVIPPVMRPISISGGMTSSADVNQLYEDFYLVHKNVKGLAEMVSPDFEDLQKARADTYGSVKAIMSGGDPVNYKNKKKGVKGLLAQIAGNKGPKDGFFQDKILSKKQDVSGRGTIYAAPDVGFNEAKLPRDQLWKMYEMHIKRDLAQKGYDVAAAKTAYEDRNPAATASFNKQVATVPVILNRAPTLMKTNILALKPIPTSGKTIGLNILHLPGYAAD